MKGLSVDHIKLDFGYEKKDSDSFSESHKKQTKK